MTKRYSAGLKIVFILQPDDEESAISRYKKTPLFRMAF